jgi:hypothetical protein
MKTSNNKFEGFAAYIIAESLKKWGSDESFIAAKLQERLQYPKDDLDRKIAEIMIDPKTKKIDLKKVPTKYDYTSGDG